MKRLKFAATTTWRSLKRAFRTRPGALGNKLRLILSSLVYVLRGYVYVDDMPDQARNQVCSFCLREETAYKYMWFRWRNFNYLEMISPGERSTGYGYFVLENELD